MLRAFRLDLLASALLATCLVASAGCTSLHEYVHNGFKVGPDYVSPEAPVAEQWIDLADLHVQSDANDLTHWWTAFNDPVLNSLIQDAYQQNLTLREAGLPHPSSAVSVGDCQGEYLSPAAAGVWELHAYPRGRRQQLQRPDREPTRL